MIPKPWARAISLIIVFSLLTGLYVATDFPTMEVKAVNHGGVITVNETWSGQLNHIILTNVTIKENVTVTIEAGADVQFEDTGNTDMGPLSIFVNGTLIIAGNPVEQVTFTSRMQANQRKPGDWGTIYYNATSNDTESRVSYAMMEFGTQGLFLEDTNILVENTEISNMSQEGILSYASSPIIRNCTVHYSNFGIWAEAGGEPLIENNTLEWNMYDGFYGVSRVNPTIINNRIWHNIDDGVHLLAFNKGEISNNTVIFNRDIGMVLNVRADVLVKDNNISRNGDAGVWIRSAAPTIQHNLITNNSRNGVRIFDCKVSQGCPSPVIVNNTIAFNNKEAGLYPGIFVQNADPLIMNNHIAHNNAEGIYLKKGSEGSISSNAIINNQIGISVNQSSPSIIDNNPISGNIAGIYVKGGEPLVRDNVLTNNKYGIYAADNAKPRIYRNVISSASGKDLYVGDKDGKITFFQNKGESVFEDTGRVKLDTGADIDVEQFATPTWADIDDDGLNDLLVGNHKGYVYYFRNLGDGFFRDMGRLMNETPVTPLGDVVWAYCHPFVIDWDQDNDLDVFCGDSLGDIYYFSNNGNDVFTNRGRLMNGTSVLDPGSKAAPFLVDWNKDGDMDLIAGSYYGDVQYYENQGGVGGIAFTYTRFLEWLEGGNATPIAKQGTNIVPWLVDWDKDSKIDLITSNETGIYLWKGFIANLLFDPAVQLISTTGEINARAVDWNTDGYYDLITGGKGIYGYVKWYRNRGDDTFDIIQLKNGTKDLYISPWSSPFPIDFDGDGILDLIIGDVDGNVRFFRGTAPQSPVLSFVSILTGAGTPQYIKVGPPSTGFSRPSAVDWNNDDRPDLVVGEVNGYVWLFTNGGNETFLAIGRAHSETGAAIRTPGQMSAPSARDWDGDRLLDLIVGDSMGYVHFWKGRDVVGDMFNFTNKGRLMADGSYLQVSSYANPFVDDWNADGDLDILVGEESGRVLYYENNGDGTLSYKGNLTNVLGGDLKVSNNAAPLGVGYYGSIKAYTAGFGIYSVDSSPDITNNIMIKGGNGNKTAGKGEMGGIGIYLLRSDATIVNNKNISGGSGGLGLTAPSGDVIGGKGGHGIVLDDSTGKIEGNVILGGMGGGAEAAAPSWLSIGGGGGSGIMAVNNTTTTISDSTIIAGDGNVGINRVGTPGAGVQAEGNSQPYIDSCFISGSVGVYADNSTPYLVNSTIVADGLSFNITNHGHAIALNTTFDKTKTYFGDSSSILETQWFLRVKVVDLSGFPVPEATITVERDGFAYQGHLSSNVARLDTNAAPMPAVVDWDEDGHLDLIVGEGDGDVVFYRNMGDGTYNTPPITLLRGGTTGMRATRPYVYDLDFDMNPDFILGDHIGNVYWYKRNGTNLEFYSKFNLLGGGVVNVSSKAAPAVGDWNMDGFWDLVVGDGGGNVNVFHREPGSFLNFTPAGYAIRTDGAPVKTLSDAIPYVIDWNADGYRDLVLSAAGLVRLYLSCDNGTLLNGGPFMANMSGDGLQQIRVGGFSTSIVLDYNEDGDLDLLVGMTNGSLIDTGHIEYFENNKNGDSRAFSTNELGEKSWIVATEFIESDRNGNHFGDDSGDKVFYTPHMIKAKKNLDIGCAAPEAVMTESRDVYVVMCRDVTPPRVVKTFPKSGQEGVQLNEKIQIWFSKPMDIDSVNQNLQMTSDIPTSPFVPYDDVWADNNTTLTLRPNPPLYLMTYDAHYCVLIKRLAEDIFGLMLDGNGNGKGGEENDDYRFCFHTEYVDPLIPPKAVLSHWPSPEISSFVRPVQLTFNGTESTDDRGIEWWEIEVDNGNGTVQGFQGDDIKNATTPAILFDVEGTFCTYLNVTDGPGLMNTSIECVTILPIDSETPVADAGENMTISPGQTITFDGSGSSDNVTPSDRLNYTWKFNNGTVDVNLTGMKPSYSDFWSLGNYVVTLNVTDEAGNWDTDNMTVRVVFDAPPEADAGPDQSVCAGTVVTLNAGNTSDDDSLANSTFNWTFNDGTNSVFLQGMVVTHQFGVPGNFLITLNVTDMAGNSDVDTAWVNVILCTNPRVEQWGPIASDKSVDTVIWAKFSKDMVRSSLFSSFTLVEFGTTIEIFGLYAYDNATFNFTYTPTEPLSYGTTYEACFNSSIAKDTQGFYLVDDFCWTFRTTEPPWVGSTDPGIDEKDVNVKADISIAFNEPMNISSLQSAFTLRNQSTVWDYTSFSMNWTSDLRVFTFANFSFDFSKEYCARIDSSIARSEKGVYLDGDMDGIPEGSPVDDYGWCFTTEPTPVVVGIPRGTDVPLDANIVMSFNRIMDWSSVGSSVTIKEGVTVVPIGTFGAVSGDNLAMTFTIDPVSLKYGTAYNITLSGDLSSGAKDLNDNSLDGNKNGVIEGSPTDDYSWEFVTEALDDDPPHVVSTYPTNGMPDVPLDTIISVTFDELMNETSFYVGIAEMINRTTYSLETFADFEWFNSNSTLLLYPRGGLAYDTNYTIVISGSTLNGVVDLAGNRLDGNWNGIIEGSPTDDYRFSFKTPDPIPPYVVNTTPQDGETNVSWDTKISATFDDDMDETTLIQENIEVRDQIGNLVNGQLFYDDQRSMLIFNPNQNLKPGREYTVNISNVRDDEGNVIRGGYYAWSFTTKVDQQAPTIDIISPQDQTTLTKGDKPLIIGTAFDDAGIETLQIRFGTGDWIDIGDYNATDGSWSYPWNTKDSDLGSVVIEVQAYDSSLLRGYDQISVQIQEGPGLDLFSVFLITVAIIIGVVTTLIFLLAWRRKNRAVIEELEAGEAPVEEGEEPREDEEEIAKEEGIEEAEKEEGKSEGEQPTRRIMK